MTDQFEKLRHYTLKLYHIMNFDFSQSAQDLLNSIVGWAPKLVSGLLILIIGSPIVDWASRAIEIPRPEKSNAIPSERTFASK